MCCALVSLVVSVFVLFCCLHLLCIYLTPAPSHYYSSSPSPVPASVPFRVAVAVRAAELQRGTAAILACRYIWVGVGFNTFANAAAVDAAADADAVRQLGYRQVGAGSTANCIDLCGNVALI